MPVTRTPLRRFDLFPHPAWFPENWDAPAIPILMDRLPALPPLEPAYRAELKASAYNVAVKSLSVQTLAHIGDAFLEKEILKLLKKSLPGSIVSCQIATLLQTNNTFSFLAKAYRLELCIPLAGMFEYQKTSADRLEAYVGALVVQEQNTSSYSSPLTRWIESTFTRSVFPTIGSIDSDWRIRKSSLPRPKRVGSMYDQGTCRTRTQADRSNDWRSKSAIC